MNNKLVLVIALSNAATLCMQPLTLFKAPRQHYMFTESEQIDDCLENIKKRILTFQIYQDMCTHIDKKNQQALEQYRNQMMTNVNHDEEKKAIHDKLYECKSNLLKEKQQLLNDVKQSNNIDDHTWDACMKKIESLQEHPNINNYFSVFTAYHDPNIDPCVRCLLTYTLDKNDINSQNVPILSRPNLPYNSLYYIRKNNNMPDEITINWDTISTFPLRDHFAICTMIAEHIIQCSLTIPSIISSIKQPDIEKSESFIALKKFYLEKLPILLPALADRTTAYSMWRFIFNHYNTSFTDDDYQMLSTIKRHWDELDWLG